MAEDMKKTEAQETEETVEETAQAENIEETTEEIETEQAEAVEETTEEAEQAEEAAEASEEAGEKKEGKKSGIFKKKEKKDKKDEQIADLTDRLQRQMAEFDNFRKRTEKEKASMFQLGAKDVIEKVLPVVDNFERGLAGADEADPFVDGMNKIYKQMMTVLTDLGVAPIEAEGAEFDPNLHNAVMHEDNPDVGENIITQELQKGYTYKDTVVRHSMVKVAN